MSNPSAPTDAAHAEPTGTNAPDADAPSTGAPDTSASAESAEAQPPAAPPDVPPPPGDGTKAEPTEGVPAPAPPRDGATFPPSVEARPVPEGAPLDHPHLYFNRELSTVDFNWRVLHQALDDRTPLLERAFFLAITGSNLDEFFQKRVGGLKRQALAGIVATPPDGRTPEEQIALIREAVVGLYGQMSRFWTDTLRPLLASEAGLCILDYDDLGKGERDEVDAYFRETVFPVLTPLAVDPGHPFPFLSNLSLSLAVTLRNPARGTDHFARIKVPNNQPRWVELEAARRRTFVPLEQVIAHNLAELFRGMEIHGAHVFRVTRNADIRRDEEEADDLLDMISEELRERRFAQVVRLEVDPAMPEHVRRLLMNELDVDRADLYESSGLLGHADCMELAGMDRPALKYDPWTPVVPARLRREGNPTQQARRGQTVEHPDIFSVIRDGDLVVHHPYESFQASTQQFVEEAADDPDVVAIKQTLYRTSDDSPIVQALMRAAEAGKQVAVLVEVKARFDEANNIEWGRMLEEAGVHVTYGLVGLKTHAKVTLVIREEADEPRIYCHVGTGNYNAKTARQYTDLGLLTCDPGIARDVVNLFHYLTGYAPEQRYEDLLVAPHAMRDRFYVLIDDEIAHAEAGRGGHIIAKMNQLNDAGMIAKLYEASQAGVEIDLVVRGHSRLRPGLAGYSETIRVVSILGRFLEHDRVYYFGGGDGPPRVFFGSADWMSRNLKRRVETVAEAKDPAVRDRIAQILHYALDDRRAAWDLAADGRHVQRVPGPADARSHLQDRLMRLALGHEE